MCSTLCTTYTNLFATYGAVCPTKKTGTHAGKKRKSSDHIPVPGQDPSLEDIERAKLLQAIPPPKCFCGLPSRLNKVKRSKESGDGSRAIGKYFFFCSKKRDDSTQCRYARPLEKEQQHIHNKKKKDGKRMKVTKEADIKKGDAATSKQICKFFAKKGNCKKGANCEFSHDVGSKKKSANKETTDEKKEVADNESSGNSSSSSDSGSGSSSDSDSD